MKFPCLHIQKRQDRRLRAGHPWVYSNEVDNAKTPLADFAPGALAHICLADGTVLGSAYVNPHSLICARRYSSEADVPLDHALLVRRLRAALAQRERFFSEPYYRLVYGESDGLPGLVVDRYGAVVVAQIGTAGMEQQKEALLAALQEVLQPQAVVWRNDAPVRELEGLPLYSAVALGELPPRVELIENHTRFIVDALAGQKTGWFYDHRLGRQRLSAYAPGQRVLDLFSYTGGWGVQAAVAGAHEVWCVDSSAPALALALENAALNQVSGQVRTLQGNVFDVLKQLRTSGEVFDIVVADPPALIKRRKDYDAGRQAYWQLNQAALQVVRPGGLLVTASCSLHLPTSELTAIVAGVGRHCQRDLVIIEQTGQGPDHPVHPLIAETEYLKALFCVAREAD